MTIRTRCARRSLRAAAASTTVGLVAMVVVASMTGPAQARQPEITANPVDPTVNVTLPPLTFVTVAPPIIPTVTFVLDPGPSGSDSTTTSAETTTSDVTTTTESTTTTTEPPHTTDAGGPGQPAAEPEYTLTIDRAQVDCDGTIRVEYSTTADPVPPGTANHIVMYNPTASPTAFTVVETTGNATNGSFAFDGPGAPDLTYRVFVIGLFDPAEPDGAKAIDQADIAVVDGC